MDSILLIPVFVPLIVGFGLLFMPGRWRVLSGVAVLLVSVLSLAVAVGIWRSGPRTYAMPLLQIDRLDLSLLLATTPLSALILVFAAGFGVLVTVYSFAPMTGVLRINEYYGSILLALGAASGIVLSDHLLFLLIFWEIATAALYLLIAAGGRHSNAAATKSFAMIGASDAAFLLGIGLVWTLTDTFVISEISLSTSTPMATAAFLLLMLAALTKAGAVPLHTWLPTSGEFAPVSVMAFLPGALDKLLGIYLLVLMVKGMFVLESQALRLILAALGAATILIGVMVAVVQHNLKRLLSFHAVSQVGYMVLGIATMTPVGIAGGLFHMLNNAIYKSCLFLCGGAVEQQAGTTDLDRLGGLGKRMPRTFVACLIAALGISGIPPLNGFVSKWMVYQGVIQMGASQGGLGAALWPLWLVVALFGSALTLASFVKVLHSVFLSRLPDALKARGVEETSGLQTLPMLILAGLCVGFGVFYGVPLAWLIYPALDMAGGQAILIGSWDSVLATGLLAMGLVIGLAIVVWCLLAGKVRTVPTWTCGEVQPNEQMIVPGTHFYKTISSMSWLRPLYAGQEKGWFDLYHVGGGVGGAVVSLLRYLHSGLLPMYVTWVTLGLVGVLLALCQIW